MGFGTATLIRMFELRANLISALVERWRLETYTFHLSCGECIITLEDVALQLGLQVDDVPITELRNDSCALKFQSYASYPDMPCSGSDYQQPRPSTMVDMFSSKPSDQIFWIYDFLSYFDTPQSSSMDDENAGSDEENIKLPIDHCEQPRRQ
ncbi:hypothetical protein PVK06_007711 [Gossypium arboreum]|uniref:Aminotransferase-like plant mobile domain-containing protein n=1 Tax=Gossypium arboreum TaxID=29729 RepID=A0ABR0QI18_GOSAR|nr:hypothetical protein PVK06_007711 [Gossypium arboreum]